MWMGSAKLQARYVDLRSKNSAPMANDSAGLVLRLQEEQGGYGGSEEARMAWESSFTKLSRAFQAPSFQPLHLFFGSRGNLALEYQLPAASSWADVVCWDATKISTGSRNNRAQRLDYRCDNPAKPKD